jgi:hypothetical protein
MNEQIVQEEPFRQEFVKAKPEILPKPTYMPFLLAFSLLLFGWGLLVNFIISAAGLLGMFISLYGWIKELLHERTDES